MIAGMSDPSIVALYEDEALLIVSKPPGWETVVEGTAGRCLTMRLRRERACPDLAPAHRLDRDTTGVQIFAKNDQARRKMEDLFRHRQVKKRYLALCYGIPRNATGVIRRRLADWRGGRRPVRVVKGREGKEAETAYRVLASASAGGDLDVALILFTPLQGRTHQIRAHAEAFGRPVLGDDQYGDRPANRIAKETAGLDRQALHAWQAAFPHPETGRPHFVEAPVPADFSVALDRWMPDWRAVLDRVAPAG